MGTTSRLTRFFPLALIAIAVVLFITGSYYGLAVAPPEQFMGEVQRIMYVHVPTAWGAMLVLTWAFVCAVAWLLSEKWQWDHRLEAAIEMSVVLCFLLSVQGAIWAKPTWGVWWDWDPRLTTVAILLMAFLGIAALRRFVEDPTRRATWSAVATVIGFVDVPIVYYSVKWWNSLHQQQSTAVGISREFRIPLLLNFSALLLLIAGVLILRARVAAWRAEEELPPVEDWAGIAVEVTP
ncbi:MAG TPA: cytochrome c biogenesis protein CcsA [Thermoanaerobaculia bacterium]|nr:cytochrome c biogenesis protein CcsA [Thermoanaerobaculia bacterium]